MPDLKYAVIFSAIDQLSDKLSSYGGGFMQLGNRVQEFGGKLSEAGEEVTRFGERLSLDAMLMQQGADRLREFSDAITEPAFAMQKSLATTAAMTGLSNTELGKLKETANAFSNTHPGVIADQYVQGFTRMREIFQDTNKAMKAEDTAAMLTRFGIDGAAATNIFGAAWANLGVDAATTGDQLIRTVQLFGLAPEKAQQLAMAVGQLGGTIKQTNTPLADMFALIGTSSLDKGGGRGMMQFATMIREVVQASADGKNAIDFTHGVAGGFLQMRAAIAGYSSMEKLNALKDMGVSNPAAMATFLDNMDQFAAKQRGVASGAATVGSAFKTATANASDQLALMHQNLTSLYDAAASPTLPWFTDRFRDLTKIVQGATSATKEHWAITKYGIIGVSAAGAVLGGVAPLLSTLGMATIGVGNSMEALSYVPTLFSKIGSAAMYFNPIAIAETAIGVATKAWAAAQWLVNLAMDANPIGIAIVGVAALAAGVYELYQHWSAVSSALASFGTWVGGWAAKLGKAILVGIAGPFGLIAYEIYSHWDSIKAACEKIGAGIKSYFVGASPPPVGPLHDLGRITIAETIAERIRPAPILTALRRTAAAAAIASTTIVAGASGPAFAGGGAGAGGGIVINAPITISVGEGVDAAALEKIVVATFEKHRYELLRALERQRAQKERTDLS